MKRLLPVLLAWTLSTQPGCQVWRLVLYDAYITGPQMVDGEPVGPRTYTEGWRGLPPTQTSFDLAPHKPYLGCVVAYRFPVAVDMNGMELPAACQPYNFTADGVAWEGM